MTADAAPTEPAPPPRPWKRLIAQLLWIGFGGIALTLGASLLVPQDLDRQGRVYEALVTIVFGLRAAQLHIAIGLVLWAILAIGFGRWLLATLSLLVAAACVMHQVPAFFPKSPPPIAGRHIRLMQMNLWMNNRNGEAVLAQIRAADPDIVVQEESSEWSLELMTQHLKGAYPYGYITPGLGSAAVYSKRPLRMGTSVSPRDERVPLLLNIDGTDVALYGVHLVSPAGRWTIMRNRQQTAELCDILSLERRPTIVIGDFNFPETSPNFFALKRAGMRSTHELAGHGIGWTWKPQTPLDALAPGVRIDHIMLSPQLTASLSYVGGNTGSDHRPVIADIGLISR